LYGTFDEPLFLAKDVAEWIDHSNPTEMVRGVDEDEKVVKNVYTLSSTLIQGTGSENYSYPYTICIY